MAPPRSVAAQHKEKLERDDPTLLPSDDEDDSDFHLSDGAGASDSGEDDDDDDDQHQAKRAKVDGGAASAPALDKATVDDLWASFNDTAALDPYAAGSSSVAPDTSTAAKSATRDAKGKGKGTDNDMIEIEVEYGFAGETIKQKTLVARSSDEAQAYLALHPLLSSSATSKFSATSSTAAPAPGAPAPKDPTNASLDALFGPDSSSAVDSPASATASSSASPAPAPAPAPAPRPTGPPKRKAGGGLAGLAASLGVGKKPPKLNTLEKSKLDWNNYVSTQEGLSDTLTHARKDGYLDRRDFLDRVEGAKERQWDEAKSKRR